MKRELIPATSGVLVCIMAKYSFSGCQRKNGVRNGKCTTHKDSTILKSSTQTSPIKIQNDSLKKYMEHHENLVAQLQNQVTALNNQVGELQGHAIASNKIMREMNEENKKLREESNFLRAKMNSAHYHCDSTEQYLSRKENIKLHEVEEKDDEKDAVVLAEVLKRANFALSKSKFYSDT